MSETLKDVLNSKVTENEILEQIVEINKLYTELGKKIQDFENGIPTKTTGYMGGATIFQIYNVDLDTNKPEDVITIQRSIMPSVIYSVIPAVPNKK